jgi:hypothetical protein
MLDLIWSAVLNDGSVITQYDEQENEIPFKKVLEQQDNLKCFYLTNKNLGIVYFVDLITGTIQHGSQNQPLLNPREDMLRHSDYKYRLIYFREVERSFNNDLQELGTAIVIYFLGFQYTDENEKNHKKIMKISSTGEWVSN